MTHASISPVGDDPTGAEAALLVLTATVAALAAGVVLARCLSRLSRRVDPETQAAIHHIGERLGRSTWRS